MLRLFSIKMIYRQSQISYISESEGMTPHTAPGFVLYQSGIIHFKLILYNTSRFSCKVQDTIWPQDLCRNSFAARNKGRKRRERAVKAMRKSLHSAVNIVQSSGNFANRSTV